MALDPFVICLAVFVYAFVGYQMLKLIYNVLFSTPFVINQLVKSDSHGRGVRHDDGDDSSRHGDDSSRHSDNERQSSGAHSGGHNTNQTGASVNEEGLGDSDDIQGECRDEYEQSNVEVISNFSIRPCTYSWSSDDLDKERWSMSNYQKSTNDRLIWVIGVPSILAFVSFSCLIIWRGLQDPTLLDRLEEYGILLGFISGPALMFMNSILELWKTEQKNEVDAIPATVEASLLREKSEHEHQMKMAQAQHQHEMKMAEMTLMKQLESGLTDDE